MVRKRVLVTGASGFIGRWSVPPLIAASYDVHAVIHSGPGKIPEPLRGAEVHTADLLDARAVEALIGAVRPSHLLHFAWIAAPGVYWTSPENRAWLAAGKHLLQSFHAGGGIRAVMAGSCAEYDWSRAQVCDEWTSPLAGSGTEPVPLYADCKLAMQRALVDFGTAHGMSTAWGRIFFQYGPAEHRDRLAASVIGSLLAGREALCSHGRQIRSFLHVADVGAAFAAVLDSRVEGPVNIGSGDRITLAQLVDEIARQLGRPDLVRFGARPAPPSEPPLLVPAVERLRNEVGWQPHFNLHDGIADTIRWWRETSSDAGARSR